MADERFRAIVSSTFGGELMALGIGPAPAAYAGRLTRPRYRAKVEYADPSDPRGGVQGAMVSKVLAGKRLVVVEDTAIIKLAIEKTLLEAGATITRSFENGADAGLLDIWLGNGSTSIPIAQALSDRKIPFLFYTGLPRSELTQIRERWPGCMIISKPALPSEIVAAVAELLGQPATAHCEVFAGGGARGEA